MVSLVSPTADPTVFHCILACMAVGRPLKWVEGVQYIYIYNFFFFFLLIT